MSDNLHSALAQFRDTMLTAVARLEFTLRDSNSVAIPNYLVNPNATWVPNAARPMRSDASSEVSESLTERIEQSEQFQVLANTLDGLMRRMAALEQRESRGSPSLSGNPVSTVLEVNDMTGILEMQPPANSRNVVIKSPIATPALAAAITAANPPDLNLSTGDSATGASEDEEEEVVEEGAEEETEEEIEEEEVEEEEAEVVEEEEEEPDLRPVTYKGQQYFVDAEHSLYTETDEGYEEVGKWDPLSHTPSFFGAEENEEVVEEEEEAEEEEAVEVEEFEYKGKTYQRDSENNVYLDGEQIGTWNGKKIIPMA